MNGGTVGGEGGAVALRCRDAARVEVSLTNLFGSDMVGVTLRVEACQPRGPGRGGETGEREGVKTGGGVRGLDASLRSESSLKGNSGSFQSVALLPASQSNISMQSCTTQGNVPPPFPGDVIRVGSLMSRVERLSSREQIRYSGAFLFPFPGMYRLVCVCSAMVSTSAEGDRQRAGAPPGFEKGLLQAPVGSKSSKRLSQLSSAEIAQVSAAETKSQWCHVVTVELSDADQITFV